ncbi:MAG: tetratricopeptide repeat protein [Chitinispirillales bacterium]|jgi:tetratricopeptide (TPR) repeat protein|nr:tetratricopeptide repeat protein [Chitinispirillales bacterium]
MAQTQNRKRKPKAAAALLSSLLPLLLTLLSVTTGGALAQGQMELELDLDASPEKALYGAIMKVADEAFQLNLKGLDALERKDNNAALDLFTQAITVFPQYTDAINNRGVVLYRRGDVAGAQRAWEEAVRRDPQYYVAYYNIGLIHIHSKKPDEAKRQFELAVKRNPKFTEAILRLGAIEMQAGRSNTALEYFAKAYKTAPRHQDAWNFYSYGLLVAKDTAGAITVLKNVGDDPEALAQLGRIEGLRKHYAQAAEYLTKAVDRGASPQALLDLASVQLDGGKCGDALTSVSNYFAGEANSSVDSWLLAGFAARECHGPAKALEYYDKGLKRYPRDPLLMRNAGQMYFSQKEYARAEAMWSDVGDAYSDPQMYYMRAVAARLRNDFGAAERLIKKAVSMDEKADYYDFLGVLSHAKGDGKAAEEHFRKALKLDPDNMSAQLNLAIKGKNAADMDKSVEDAAKRLSSCGNDCVDAALQLSILYYHQKKYDKAVSTLESVKDADRNIRVYRHIAIFNKEMQRYDRAVSVLEAAVAKFPNDLQARYELAEACLSSGNPAKAAKIFAALLPKWKTDVWRLHYQLGYACMEQNELTSAKSAFEKSMAARKDNPAARALLAFVLNRMGETDRAVDQWEKTVTEDGSNSTVHINLGLSYESKGQYDKALESYKKAQSLNSSDKAVYINLGNAYQGLGRTAEAFDAFTRGLESNKRELAAYNIFLLSRKRGDADRADKMHALLKKEFPSSVYYSRVSAEMELVKGDTAKALSACESIKEKDAHDWFAVARAAAALGQKAKAESALAKVPDDSVWKREKSVVRARLAFNGGDYRGAYQAYKEAVHASGKEGGADADAIAYNMIFAACKGGMHKEALEAADDAIKKAAGNARAEICRAAGDCAVAAKRWADAKNWFTKLSTAEPNNAAAQYNIAVAHYNLGEVEESYNRYQKARELDRKIQNKDIELRYEQFKRGGPSQQKEVALSNRTQNDSLDTWYNRAVGLQNAKKVDQAESLYKKILEQDPAFSYAWNNLGAIYGARGDLDQAEAAYLKALETQPSPETYANLANIYIAQNDNGKAGEIVAKGLEKNPNSAALKQLERKLRGKK